MPLVRRMRHGRRLAGILSRSAISLGSAVASFFRAALNARSSSLSRMSPPNVDEQKSRPNQADYRCGRGCVVDLDRNPHVE